MDIPLATPEATRPSGNARTASTWRRSTGHHVAGGNPLFWKSSKTVPRSLYWRPEDPTSPSPQPNPTRACRRVRCHFETAQKAKPVPECIELFDNIILRLEESQWGGSTKGLAMRSSRKRFKLVSILTLFVGVTIAAVTVPTPASAACEDVNNPWPTWGNAFTHERVNGNTCDDDGEYRGQLKDIAVGNGHCAIVQIDTGGWWGGRRNIWNCRDNAWNNYQHWDADHRADIRLCESRNGGGVQNCSGWIKNKGF